MARNLTAGWIAAATARVSYPFLLWEGEFASETLRLSTLDVDIEWDSRTWLGNGYLLDFEGGEETIDTKPSPLAVILNGVPEALVSLALSDVKQNAPGSLWIGFLDEDNEVVEDPYNFYVGKCDTAEILEDPEDPRIKILYNSELADFDRPRELRWTHALQTHLYAGDLGFQYVNDVQRFTGLWGKQKQKPQKRRKRPKAHGGAGGRGSQL